MATPFPSQTEDDYAALLRDEESALVGPLADYCARFLKIRTKKGGPLHPFIFNRTQHYIDARINAQMEQTHRVRAMILKGRKLGASTYVAARYFRKQHNFPGQQVYILSHEKESSEYLFGIAKTYYLMLPDRHKPALGKMSARHMTFPVMGCEYRVGTAGQQETGRSQTPQLFHGSEAAFWPHAETHMAGAVQAVGDVDGTEIIMESTANGIGGAFYNKWKQAERGESDFIPIFVPWYWGEDCVRTPPHSWKPEGEIEAYQRLYALTDQQLYWFYLKNLELGGTPDKIAWRCRQEYPGNAQEAFQGKGAGSFISVDLVQMARRRGRDFKKGGSFSEQALSYAPRILGVDVARSNEEGEGKTRDRNRFIDRQGRAAGRLVNEVMATDDLVKVAHRIAVLIEQHGFDMVFIDVTGIGAGVYDMLRNQGFGPRVTPVNFGSEAIKVEQYKNKRAEMWGEMKEWFADPGGAEIPDDDDLASHITAPTAEPDSNSRMQLEPKKAIKKRLGFSPDGGDALALTFAAPVSKISEQRETWRRGLAAPKKRISWMGR